LYASSIGCGTWNYTKGTCFHQHRSLRKDQNQIDWLHSIVVVGKQVSKARYDTTQLLYLPPVTS
jgi:hypothetical protein